MESVESFFLYLGAWGGDLVFRNRGEGGNAYCVSFCVQNKRIKQSPSWSPLGLPERKPTPEGTREGPIKKAHRRSFLLEGAPRKERGLLKIDRGNGLN